MYAVVNLYCVFVIVSMYILVRHIEPVRSSDYVLLYSETFVMSVRLSKSILSSDYVRYSESVLPVRHYFESVSSSDYDVLLYVLVKVAY